MKHCSLAELADEYEVFLLDQFGVLLDGVGAYPGAAVALETLASQGKAVGILTNSGKRAALNAARLERMGFNQEHITAVISSGEAARITLKAMLEKTLAKGSKILVLSRDNDRSCIAGLPVCATEDPKAADMVLIAGSRGDEMPLEAYEVLLEDPANRGVPALCTNPDMVMLTKRGSFFGAGRIAELYRDLGGRVDEIGKPHRLIYQVALERLGVRDPAAVLCIGDSPSHDIRGAHAAGCRTALVRTGIHENESLDRLLSKVPRCDIPDYVIPGFKL